MSKVLFISVAELKRKTNIDGNVDDDKIVQYIETAQDRHVQNYMGTNLYRSLQNKLSAGTIDDVENAAYKTLWLTYVKSMVTWFAIESYLPWAMFKITNGGLQKHQSENAISASLEEMRVLLAEARENAEHYTRRFIDYINDNPTLFDEYFSTSNNSDMRPDRDVNFTGGWVL